VQAGYSRVILLGCEKILILMNLKFSTLGWAFKLLLQRETECLKVSLYGSNVGSITLYIMCEPPERAPGAFFYESRLKLVQY
jgi:hypothetical protein